MGKSLSNQFARRGSLPILLSFGFALGFSAVVAEPALIAVAHQAEEISQGRINGLTLRLLIAVSVVTLIFSMSTMFARVRRWTSAATWRLNTSPR